MRSKEIVVALVGTLVLTSLFVVGFLVWRANSGFGNPAAPSSPSPSSPSPSTINGSDVEVLKAKLDSYSRQADDLQKLLTLLLTLTTIYTITLAVSAYKTVKDNLRDSEKGIERLNAAIASSDDVIKKQIEELERQTLYTRRIAVATAISQFPPKQEDYQEVQDTFVKQLMEMRTGSYATDPMLNQQIARLYVARGLFRDAEQVMTTLIERKRDKGERTDDAITNAYYDRACFRALQWPDTSEPERKNLISGIKRDLARAFRLNSTLRESAKDDRELKAVAGEPWFQALFR